MKSIFNLGTDLVAVLRKRKKTMLINNDVYAESFAVINYENVYAIPKRIRRIDVAESCSVAVQSDILIISKLDESSPNWLVHLNCHLSHQSQMSVTIIIIIWLQKYYRVGTH